MPGTLDSSGIVRPGSINSPTLQVYTVYRGAERIPLHYGVNTDMIGELLDERWTAEEWFLQCAPHAFRIPTDFMAMIGVIGKRCMCTKAPVCSLYCFWDSFQFSRRIFPHSSQFHPWTDEPERDAVTQALRGQTGPLQIEPFSCDLDIWKYNLVGALLVLIILAKKHCKNCECCPVSLLIVKTQRLSGIQVLNFSKMSKLSKFVKIVKIFNLKKNQEMSKIV